MGKRTLQRRDAAEHWTKMLRSTMSTPAWRALSPLAQALYPWLKLEWRGPDANNNGKIGLSVRQAAEYLGVSIMTATKGFHELQAKGFIVLTQHASLGVSGAAKSAAYEVTELALPTASPSVGRKLYQGWQPGHEFPVHKCKANNPKGRNGKSKPCHEKDDGTVIDFGTKSRVPS